MIVLRAQNVQKGDTEFRVNDKKASERKKLAQDIEKLVKSGHLVFLETKGKPELLIQGYNPEKNRWILRSHRGKKHKKAQWLSAEDTAVAAQPVLAGG